VRVIGLRCESMFAYVRVGGGLAVGVRTLVQKPARLSITLALIEVATATGFKRYFSGRTGITFCSLDARAWTCRSGVGATLHGAVFVTTNCAHSNVIVCVSNHGTANAMKNRSRYMPLFFMFSTIGPAQSVNFVHTSRG
jgi:hypothetical protein